VARFGSREPVRGRSFLVTWFLLCGIPGFAQSHSNRGQELFSQRCAICHGATGGGALGPSLSDSQWQADITDQALQHTIREGVPGTSMPSFKSTLTADQIAFLVRPGMSGSVGGYTGAGAPWMRSYRSGETLFVFALFGAKESPR